MLVLHIANKNYSSWSLRPWLLMRMAGIAFQEVRHEFGAGSNFETFRGFSPSGKVPCLVDGEVAVWDSLAIAEYLAETNDAVWPADRAARAWARSAAAEMHSGFSVLRDICAMSCGQRIALHQIPETLAAEIARIDELWTEGPERFGGPFLAGPRFSAADAFFAPVAFRVQTYGLGLGAPAMGYCRRLLALEPMREWYADALAETWREPGHEAEAVRHGTVTEDLRAHA